MKLHILVIIALFVLLAVPREGVYGENLIEYTLQIGSDGSAACMIKQTGVNITNPWGMLSELQTRVASLVNDAINETGRSMACDEDSMSVNIYTSSDSNVIVEYKFIWENFSKTENAKIIIGDVFEVEDFFSRLYGYGTVYIIYPSQYIVETVSPQPTVQNEQLQILVWLGTTLFQSGEPSVILKEKASSSGILDTLAQNIIPILGLVVTASGMSVGFYVFRRRNRREAKSALPPAFPVPVGIESDEEKTLKLLRASGGSVYQSAITDQCRFSRAKTSQLLAVLESKGVVTRYKKGRDKVVVLVEKSEK